MNHKLAISILKHKRGMSERQLNLMNENFAPHHGGVRALQDEIRQLETSIKVLEKDGKE